MLETLEKDNKGLSKIDKDQVKKRKEENDKNRH